VPVSRYSNSRSSIKGSMSSKKTRQRDRETDRVTVSEFILKLSKIIVERGEVRIGRGWRCPGYHSSHPAYSRWKQTPDVVGRWENTSHEKSNEWMSFKIHLKKISVVHSDRPISPIWNALPNSRVRSYEVRDSVVATLSPHNVGMLQGHRYLDPPILGGSL
jgi:hypothetical protein